MKKLLNDFYQIKKMEVAETLASFQVIINPLHPIFEGHFPGHPVVPGVCMMQMIKELTQEVLGCRLRVALIQDMKFLAVIDPSKNNQVQVSLTLSKVEGFEQVSANISNGQTVHFKFRGNFTRV